MARAIGLKALCFSVCILSLPFQFTITRSPQKTVCLPEPTLPHRHDLPSVVLNFILLLPIASYPFIVIGKFALSSDLYSLNVKCKQLFAAS